MTEGLLRSRLEPVARRRSQIHFWRRLAVGWTVAAGIALFVYLVQRLLGWASILSLPVLTVFGTVVAFAIALRGAEPDPELRRAATEVEARHPELDGLLLTAVQQRGRPQAPLGYLQRVILRDAVAHSRKHSWTDVIPAARLAGVHGLHLVAFALFLFSLWTLRTPGNPLRSPLIVRTAGVTVTPGDVSVERGESLVVLARFGSSAPTAAELVIGDTPETERRMPLTRSLSDPVFGATIPDVSQSLSYRVAYDGHDTRKYQVTVFEYPRLERADAQLTFPEYTRQPARRVEDTRRVTAVEGTRLDLALQLNKPVASARLIPRKAGQPELSLDVATNRATAALQAFVLEDKASYELVLIDDEGRTNKVPAPFVFEVLPNRTPELKLASPRGDVRPSALEEIRFEGTVWDDFGVIAHGIGFNLVGEEPRILEVGRDIPASEKHPFQHVLQLEELHVEPDQLLSWYVWADDMGPDGKVRRTTGDLYFAEIRPFEEIFRQGDSAQNQEQQEGGEGGQNPAQELLRLQKQIVSATWKLRRDTRVPTEPYAKDVEVVRDSQSQALEQAEAAAGRATEPRSRALMDAVVQDMSRAVVRLGDAGKSVEALSTALEAEQAAYQGLIKLQARETEVTRSRRGQGQGGESANQRQLDQLELTEEENRYETQRQAQSPSTPERREQLQVLNRLQELARRQEDMNERLKELQTALQAADTEAERQELRRQLKRLEEEQRQMLSDLDELNQRTQRPENQARMSDLQRQIEQTREDMRRASEATGEGQVSQALAAGTRAQRQLQTMRDDLRKENSSQFAEDLREMRAAARELERQQQQIGEEITGSKTEKRRTLSEADKSGALLERLAEQKQRMTNLIDRATQLSEAAETTEPLVSQHLYDTLRQLNQDEARGIQSLEQELIERGRMTRSLYERLRNPEADESAKTLEATAEMIRQGYEAEAAEAGDRAQTNIVALRRGVERAAQSVLGDDTAALQLARDELQALSDQLEREIQDAAPGNPSQASAANGQGNRDPSESEDPNGQGGAESANAQGSSPGESGAQTASRGQANAPGGQGGREPGDPTAPGQEGAGASQNEGAQQARANAEGGQESNGANPQSAQQASSGGQPGDRQPGQQGDSQAQASASGNQGGRGGNTPSDAGRGGRQNRAGQNRGGGGPSPGFNLDDLVGGGGGTETRSGPITSEAFAPWSDRLREVEELIEMPELRDQVATARERARLERAELRRERKKPDWAVVKLEVLKPLVEVRRELDAELSRRASNDPLVPIDRDPVPTRFSDLVRRYYEQLGRDH